jgi:hypothetical protein
VFCVLPDSRSSSLVFCKVRRIASRFARKSNVITRKKTAQKIRPSGFFLSLDRPPDEGVLPVFLFAPAAVPLFFTATLP